MIRSKLAFGYLAVMTSLTGTVSIDWTFLKDDSGSTSSPSSLDMDKKTSSTTERAGPSGPSLLDAPSALDLVSGSSSFDSETLLEKYATPSTAVSTVRSTYRNWVGPWSISSDTSCYREAHIMDVCPSNFDRNELTNTCWTECPLEFPLECGMECARQNTDCGLEVASKVSALAMAVLGTATFGVIGEMVKLGKKLTWAVKCTHQLLLVMRGIIRYVRNVKTEDPQASQDKLLLMLYQTNNVVTDLPMVIYACMGQNIPSNLRLSQIVLATAQWMLLQALTYDDDIISSWQRFRAFMKGANFTEAAEEITEGEIASLETAMQQNSSCAGDLKSLTDRVWMTVNEYREDNPGISDDELRLKISESDLVLYDVAIVTNNCMHQLISESSVETAYKTREALRKTFGVIINDLIKSGKSDNGTSLDEKAAAYKWIDMGLSTISASMIDPTDIATLLSEYIQTICGPTQFMGEIDDGTEDATLGLNTLQRAFKGSSSSWTRVGDGAVIINFTSTDTKDVSVNIMSGGDKIEEVDVKAGGTAQWTSNITTLGGKTLYLDRWRPGFLGFPGTGGGSLVLWVPRASRGGHLELNVKINVS
ncbi:hypothetical protein F443_18135 [Phytophthora nicotianae P1569]|uniref:Uncharacterized protein n=4 Tax=Phytophthora nicotianae TaxID=4792 RepID=V9EAG9_PHYNI|nr:hypothetical protein F443_18135 [Phytophthora nicotianae P1569]